MSHYVRLSDIAFSNDDCSSLLVWSEVENAVVGQFNIRPFGALREVTHPSFKYVQSSRRKERFDTLAHHTRFNFNSTIETIEKPVDFSNLGPIETDLLRFMSLPYPHLGILVGGMGGGKVLLFGTY